MLSYVLRPQAFGDCDEAGPNEPGIGRSVAAHALDPEAAQRLWPVSEQTIKV